MTLDLLNVYSNEAIESAALAAIHLSFGSVLNASYDTQNTDNLLPFVPHYLVIYMDMHINSNSYHTTLTHLLNHLYIQYTNYIELSSAIYPPRNAKCKKKIQID